VARILWPTVYIEYIIFKAVFRLYFLKQLKRAGLSSSHLGLLHFCTTDQTSTQICHCLTALAPYFESDQIPNTAFGICSTKGY